MRNSIREVGALLTVFGRDHGGGVDAARAQFGGDRIAWADLSTGINPCPYPLPALPQADWAALPDRDALTALEAAARRHWRIPENAAVLAASGASALIAQLPMLAEAGTVHIPEPTYNEHAAAFLTSGWQKAETGFASAQVVVQPNNPDGRIWTAETLPAPDAALTVIDESFCDTMPEATLMHLASRPGTVILKSFGKFWGLAGVRLGFAIGDVTLIERLRASLGPWAVSGPALMIGTQALEDDSWTTATRARLSQDSARLDALLVSRGAEIVGGTPLFRLYRVEDAQVWQRHLAHHRIWSRVFPYNPRWLRLGLPHPLHWARLEAALRS